MMRCPLLLQGIDGADVGDHVSDLLWGERSVIAECRHLFRDSSMTLSMEATLLNPSSMGFSSGIVASLEPALGTPPPPSIEGRRRCGRQDRGRGIARGG